jgi:hypothetical protein
MRKPYRLHNFVIDVIATSVTGGVWLIWVVIREVQRKR